MSRRCSNMRDIDAGLPSPARSLVERRGLLPVARARTRDPVGVQAGPAPARQQRAGARDRAQSQHCSPLRRLARHARVSAAGSAHAQVPARAARARPRLLGHQLDGDPRDLGPVPAAAERRDGSHGQHGHPGRLRHRLRRALPQLAPGPARHRSQPARRLAPARLLHVDGQGPARVSARRRAGGA